MCIRDSHSADHTSGSTTGANYPVGSRSPGCSGCSDGSRSPGHTSGCAVGPKRTRSTTSAEYTENSGDTVGARYPGSA